MQGRMYRTSKQHIRGGWQRAKKAAHKDSIEGQEGTLPLKICRGSALKQPKHSQALCQRKGNNRCVEHVEQWKRQRRGCSSNQLQAGAAFVLTRRCGRVVFSRGFLEVYKKSRCRSSFDVVQICVESRGVVVLWCGVFWCCYRQAVHRFSSFVIKSVPFHNSRPGSTRRPESYRLRVSGSLRVSCARSTRAKSAADCVCGGWVVDTGCW